ncbi:hypothetical protein STBA_02750 [Streptomyces sp. MP131-18]|nr:hypothetical protein STBA_02750 [Streptomyces sp. MP131-18]
MAPLSVSERSLMDTPDRLVIPSWPTDRWPLRLGLASTLGWIPYVVLQGYGGVFLIFVLPRW